VPVFSRRLLAGLAAAVATLAVSAPALARTEDDLEIDYRPAYYGQTPKGVQATLIEEVCADARSASLEPESLGTLWRVKIGFGMLDDCETRLTWRVTIEPDAPQFRPITAVISLREVARVGDGIRWDVKVRDAENLRLSNYHGFSHPTIIFDAAK
jgi:hypothetical protein